MKLDSAVFYSNDIKKTVAYYQDILGLHLEFQHGEHYASITFSNGAQLGIKQKSEEREVPGYQTVFISEEDIDALYKALKAKGVVFYHELSEHPWGIEFSILDPDLNKVLFVERTA